jgi:nucleotide-binding universal stress UspA family protein
MALIQKILVPVDFSESSRAALEYAAELARPFEATIDVVHVWQPPTFISTASLPEAPTVDASLIELVRKNADEATARLAADAKKQGLPVREARAEPGVPARTIVEIAKADGYDLVVIGTHGRTGLSHAVMGSVAERVVRHAQCPVLTVRPGFDLRGSSKTARVVPTAP